IFLNHSYNLPEDLFGSVEKSELQSERRKTDGGQDWTLLKLVFTVSVNETNQRAIDTWKSIQKGAKIGASVSVLITDKIEMKDGRRAINGVYYLETSVVSLPMNRDSWVQRASKALANFSALTP